MRSVIIALFVVLTTACVTTESIKQAYDNPGWPGYITVSKSEFDGRDKAKMEPAYLSDATSTFRLGLRWDSRFDAGQYMLLAEWGGAENFSPDSTLDLNIDGEFISLLPVDSRQYGIVSKKIVRSGGLADVAVDMGNMTIKQYWVSKALLDRIIEANKVVVRVSLLDTYWEERLEPTAEALPTYDKYPYVWAKAGFAKFLATVTPGADS